MRENFEIHCIDPEQRFQSTTQFEWARPLTNVLLGMLFASLFLAFFDIPFLQPEFWASRACPF